MNKIKFWLPLALYSGMIFYLSNIPGYELPPLFGLANFTHLPEYFLWGFLALIAFRNTLNLAKSKIAVIILLFGFSFAAFDEIHQLFIVGRNFSYLDLTFDVIGIALGVYLFHDRNLSV
jgi:VanZ family protein